MSNKPTTKIAIVGSRSFKNYQAVKSVLDCIRSTKNISIVSGGARGADFLGKRYAIEHELEYMEFPAMWDVYGKRAGFMRNTDIVNYSDEVIAFWDQKSRGTKDTIEKAKKCGKKLFIFNLYGGFVEMHNTEAE